MPEFSLAALRGLLPQMRGANFGTLSPQELGDMPLAELQPRGEDTSPVQYRTASPYVNITERDIADATEAAMASSGGGLGIKAYHSSPHDFERFDLSKIGTGEGAQVYGHGLYFAENPAVSGQGGQYWKQFLPRFTDSTERAAAVRLQEAGFDRAKAIEAAQRDMEAAHRRAQGSPGDFHRDVVRSNAAQIDLLKGDKPVGPRTYEVDINADPAHFLDWDKPLSQQPLVQKNIEPLLKEYQLAPSNYLGESLHKEMTDFLQSHQMSKKAAAEAAAIDLRSTGIPGIKYLDEGSRMHPHDIQYAEGMIKKVKPDMVPAWEAELARLQAVPTTSNYVVFNPGIIDIMRKYGLAGLAPLAGVGAVAGQGQDQPQQVY